MINKPLENFQDQLHQLRGFAKTKVTKSLKNVQDISEMDRLLHELEVHQVELEMQNEELLRAYVAQEESHELYLNLFEFAPVGYITLSDDGLICEANIAAALLLGIDRSNLLKTPFTRYLTSEFADCYHRLCAKSEPNNKQSFEIKIKREAGDLLYIQVEMVVNIQKERILKRRITLSDITKIKQTEIKASLSENQLLATLSAIPGSVFELGLDSRYYKLYSQRTDLISGPSEELIGQLLCDVLPTDASNIVMKALQEANDFGVSRDNQFQLEVPEVNGWIEFSVVRRVDASNEDPRFIFLASNITERRKVEIALHESELKFRTLTNAMPQIVWITSSDGYAIYFNQQWFDYTGLTLEESEGHGWILPFHPDDKKLAWDAWQLSTKTGSIYKIESRLRGIDGSYSWWLIRGTQIFNKQGEVVNWYGTCTDISEQKQAEQLLINKDKLFNLLFQGTGDGIWKRSIVEGDASYSMQWKAMLGYEDDEIKNNFNEWILRVHPDDLQKPLADVQAYLSGNVPIYSTEYRMLCKDGSYKNILSRGIVSAYTADGEPTHMVGTHTDITKFRQGEQELISAKQQAEVANMSKSRFLAAASHDLRQPLAALSIYVDALIKKAPQDDSGLGVKIQSCVHSLSELLNDLLDVSKLDAGVIAPKLTDFPINDLLQAMENINSPEALLKGLRLRVRYSNITVRTDKQLMQRMLGNLVTNSIRYTEKGGILIGCRHYQDRQWIEVWDTGIGIPEEKTDSIFEEFTQLDDARSKGSGLGLAIVRKSAKLLGLKVRIRSRFGHGSMFAIEIPQGQMIQNEEIQKSKPPSISLKIGLVDDNESVLDAFTFALNSFGYEVIAATSGKELFEQMGNQKPDILISDYRLADGKNGLDLVAEARRLFACNLPAIILTGDTCPELLYKMAKHGVTVCHKPLKIDTLEAIMLELVNPKVPS